jgi:hypothetical protein
MAKSGNFFHTIKDDTDVAAINQTFDGAKVSSLTLNEASSIGSRFSGKIEGIIVKVSGITGGAAKLTIKGQAGGLSIIPDTEAIIALDVGSTTAGTVAYYAGLVWANTDDIFKLYYTCDAGGLLVDSVTVTWSE